MLEELTGVEAGGVIFYIPDKLVKKREPQMLLKEALVLVQTKYGIETLEKLGERVEHTLTIGNEIMNLKSKHKALFKASLFVSGDVLNDEKRRRLKLIAKNWLEGEEPISIVSSISEKNYISLNGQVESVAARLYEEFNQTNFALDSKVCSLRLFVDSAKTKLVNK